MSVAGRRLASFTIGRGNSSEVRLKDQSVSKRHAEITIGDGGRYYVIDCNSTSGTWARGEKGWTKIRQQIMTRDDAVRFGHHETTIAAIAHAFDAAQKKLKPQVLTDKAPPKMQVKRAEPAPEQPSGAVRRNPLTGDIESL